MRLIIGIIFQLLRVMGNSSFIGTGCQTQPTTTDDTAGDDTDIHLKRLRLELRTLEMVDATIDQDCVKKYKQEYNATGKLPGLLPCTGKVEMKRISNQFDTDNVAKSICKSRPGKISNCRLVRSSRCYITYTDDKVERGTNGYLFFDINMKN